MVDEKFQNYSLASKARMSATPPEVRKARASAAAIARWARTPKEKRIEHSRKMTMAKQFGGARDQIKTSHGE